MYKKKYTRFTNNKKKSKVFSILVIPNGVCIIISDMKSVMGKSFRSFLFYSNLMYGKFREPYLAHANLNLLNNEYFCNSNYFSF